MDYLDFYIVLKLESFVGTPIKFDVNTDTMLQGSFTWACIEVDLSKPLTYSEPIFDPEEVEDR